ncbi:MAG: competence/damage-inducible protein A [Candidatus Hermodarchaeota archaeon]
MVELKIGIIVIGDEILSGHVLDTNTNWLLKKLRKMNHEVSRVEIIPDNVELIANAITRFLNENYDVIFVSGGLGPTHDDVTVEGVAIAIEKSCITSKEALEIINRQYRKFHELKIIRSANIDEIPGAQKMAVIPEGSILLEPMGTAPGLFIPFKSKSGYESKIFVLPGVPMEFKSMFNHQIENKLLEKNPNEKFSVEIISKTEEARLFPLLMQLKREYSDVKIGSYPNIEKMHVLLRITGKKEDIEKISQIIREKLKVLRPG